MSDIAPVTSRGKFLQWLTTRVRALRVFSLPVSVLPVLVATAAVRNVGQWDWSVFIASILGVGLLHGAGNLLNDYFDFRSGVDRRLDGDENRPGRLLVRGELKPAHILLQSIVCLLLGGAVAAFLTWQCGVVILYFGAAGVFALYAYTGPPLKLKYRALGEPLIFLTFGPLLMVGAAYAQTGYLELTALLVSIPVGAATTAILVGNNIRDREEDRAPGIKTLGQIGSGRPARILYILLVTGSVLGIAALGTARVASRVVLAAPVLLVLQIKPLVCVCRNKRLPDIDARTARWEAILLLFLFLSFVFRGNDV